MINFRVWKWVFPCLGLAPRWGQLPIMLYTRGCVVAFGMVFITSGNALEYRFRVFAIVLGYKMQCLLLI